MHEFVFSHVLVKTNELLIRQFKRRLPVFFSLCHFVPGLSKLLLPRINPFALIAAAGGIANIVTYILIDMK